MQQNNNTDKEVAAIKAIGQIASSVAQYGGYKGFTDKAIDAILFAAGFDIVKFHRHRNKDAKREIERLKDEVDQLNATIAEYVDTINSKDGQIADLENAYILTIQTMLTAEYIGDVTA